MKVKYRVMDPTGNITILVGTEVEIKYQPSVAARLMEIEPSAEQVGFVGGGGMCDIALRMAGGEFCGNAAMSAAVAAALDAGEKNAKITVLVSGAEDPVEALVQQNSDGSWNAAVNMPRPAGIKKIVLKDGPAGKREAAAVEFKGISHIITEDEIFKDRAEELIKQWCADLKADGLGIMFLDAQGCRMTPLVYIPAAGTLFWESSCASGTCAAGVYLAAKTGKAVNISLKQPGGSLGVRTEEDGNIYLMGTVRAGEVRSADISL